MAALKGKPGSGGHFGKATELVDIAKMKLSPGEEQFEFAIKAANAALKKDPSCTVAYYYRGESLALIGKYKEALADLDKALKEEIGDPEMRQPR